MRRFVQACRRASMTSRWHVRCWQQTHTGGVISKTSSVAKWPPPMQSGAGSVPASGREADHEAACGDTELDSAIMHADNVELVPERCWLHMLNS
jgi:hypothetical protein